jgi:hypothetical protein
MNKFKVFLILLPTVFIYSCTQLENVRVDFDNLSSQWEDINLNDTQISVKDFEDKIAGRRSLSLDNKIYLESLLLDNGSLIYARYNKPKSGKYSISELLKRKFKETQIFKDKGYELLKDSITEKTIEGSVLAYGVLSSKNQPICLFFANEKESKQYEIAFGTYCSNNKSVDLNTLKNKLLTNVANKILFDRGNYARSQLFAKANKGLEEIRNNDTKVEKNKPIINILGSWKNSNNIFVKANVQDDSKVDAIWVADTLISNKNDFFVEIKNSNTSIDSSEIIVIDIYGNTTRKTLKFDKKLQLSQTPETYNNKPVGKNYALIISVEDYKNKEQNFDLDTPNNDAILVSNVLRNDYNFEIIAINNPTEKSFRKTLVNFSKKLTTNDRVLIYYAGHGYLYPENAPKDRQSSYWLMSDFDFNHPENWVSDGELRQIMSKIPSRQVMLVSDSCYSGRLSNSKSISFSNIDKNNLTRTVLTSGSDQPVPDSFNKTNSPFAIAFADGLKRNSSNNLTGNNLYKKVVDIMLDSGNFYQQPQYGVLVENLHKNGSDFLVKNKN